MNLTYVDTSGIAKLFIAEAETRALKKYLGSNLITSGISRLAVQRVIDRNLELYLKPGTKVLDNFQFIEPDQTILAIAENFRSMPFLRSLDALHLARASELTGLNVLAPT